MGKGTPEEARREMSADAATLNEMEREFKPARRSWIRRPQTLPEAPTRNEVYEYFGGGGARRRRLSLLLQVLTLGSLYGFWEVFSKSWVWWPMLLILLVLVPWHIFSILLTAQRPVITLQTHTATVASGWRNRTATVDVFLPTAGEDIAILKNTYRNVTQLIWDGLLRVHVLDDMGRAEVAAAAAAAGFAYHARPDRGMDRKAGNLNHGLAISDADFIAVFDADFAPAPNFLTETIPYFVDPSIGIVQTAQYFGTKKRNTRNWLEQLGGSIQSTFYMWSQPSRQSSNTAFCVGTNVVYRRAALTRAGGFPLVPHGEDIVTTLALLAYDFKTVYVPLVLARGVSPDTFAATINQQYRWCSSAFSQIVPHTVRNIVPGIYKKAPLSLIQRVIFASAVLYYLQSALELVVMVGPSLVMLWFYPWLVQPGNYIPIAPSMLGMLAMPSIIRGWRPTAARLSLLYGVAHALAIKDAFKNHTAVWVTTGDSTKRSRSRVTVIAAVMVRVWVVLTQGLAWWALVRDVPVYSLSAYWAAILLTAVQTLIFAPLLLPSFGTMGRFRQLRSRLVGGMMSGGA